MLLLRSRLKGQGQWEIFYLKWKFVRKLWWSNGIDGKERNLGLKGTRIPFIAYLCIREHPFHIYFRFPDVSNLAFAASAFASASACLCFAFSSLSLRMMDSRAR